MKKWTECQEAPSAKCPRLPVGEVLRPGTGSTGGTASAKDTVVSFTTVPCLPTSPTPFSRRTPRWKQSLLNRRGLGRSGVNSSHCR